MPMSIEAVVAMQACARIGAIHSVVFGGFSAKALQRAHRRCRRDARHHRRRADARRQGAPAEGVVDEALAMGGCEAIKTRDRLPPHRRRRRLERRRATSGGTTSIVRQADTCEPEWVGAEHPLFILYTSGSTGKPKGVQHSHRRLPAGRHADDEVDVRLQADATSSGAPPTSAGSPATPTSPTARWPSARPRSSSRACRPIPTPGASGR